VDRPGVQNQIRIIVKQFAIGPAILMLQRRLVRDANRVAYAMEIDRYIDGEIDRWLFFAAPAAVKGV